MPTTCPAHATGRALLLAVLIAAIGSAISTTLIETVAYEFGASRGFDPLKPAAYVNLARPGSA